MRPFKLSAQAILLAAASAMPFAAQAQDNTDADAPEAEEEQRIVVIGSRISRDPNIGAPAPVISLDAEALTQTGGSDVVDVLRDVPALSTSTTSEGSIDGVFSGNVQVGQSVLNLRGLGENRTLVLVNGRRHVSGIAGQQAVDINSIPTALIERVETLTGGASALYGSDAVTGVVNFVLKDDFEGLQANVQSGISSEGDAWRINGDLTWGTNFADGRGNFVVTGEYARNDELQFGERSFSRNNGIFDDAANPALRLQTGELNATDTPNFIANGAVLGGLIPTDTSGFTPTAAEQALINRSLNAPRRFIAGDPRFSLSSAGGIVAPGDIGLSDGPDINGNGTPDCLESAVGFNSTFNAGAFGLAGGCAVINPDGTLSVYQDGQITGLFNQFGGDGIQNNFDVNSLIPETERWSVNAMLTYEISPAATIFAEGKYVSSYAEFQAQPNTFYDLLTIRADNPFITPDLQQYVAPLFFGNGTDEGFYLTRDPADLGPNRNRNEFETYRFVGGVRGETSDHFSYEVSANYGRSTQTVNDANRVIMDRFFAAIDVTSDAAGNPICRSDIDPTAPATTPFGIPAGDPGFFTFNPGDGSCRPANVLGGVGAISQDAIDFITTTVVNEFQLEQLVFSAFFTGDTGAFFELPGGPVGFAFGMEYREERSESVFDPLVLGVIPVTTPDANQGDLLRNLGFAQNSLVFDPASVINNAGGDFNVYDIFTEVRLPILSGVPFAETLELSGAARLSSYSTVGDTFTWNVSGLWAPSEDILFRGTYAQAVRAPNINELFNPAQGAFFRPVDPCDAGNLVSGADPALRQANCEALFADLGFDPTLGTGTYSYVDPLTARFSGSISGNPDLQEETATTWTVGAQITPRFLPGFVFSIDYYNIEIEDAINAVSAQDIVDNCVDSATIDNAFCTLVDRGANGGFTFLRQSSLNFARQETAGVEASMQYRFGAGPLDFTFNASGTWVDKLNNFFDPADPTLVDPELGELQRPEWAGRASLTAEYQSFSLTWGTTYLDEMGLRAVEIETVGNTGADTYSFANGIASDVFIHDITFSFEATDNIDLYGGVNNVFNRKPFVTEQAYPVSPVGTLFFLGATLTM
ncbi:TonB-dependent receptor [uncultured Erythrobacter sp.]|uniref:TonB-dependent receptor domain-containing protein n=1 Tax=uncultured Erythrobacter sp. TaxID=263913 RepID=UPI00262493AB|nr:TonB-dependent receptor [uncultured Erythrobacter sp.]